MIICGFIDSLAHRQSIMFNSRSISICLLASCCFGLALAGCKNNISHKDGELSELRPKDKESVTVLRSVEDDLAILYLDEVFRSLTFLDVVSYKKRKQKSAYIYYIKALVTLYDHFFDKFAYVHLKINKGIEKSIFNKTKTDILDVDELDGNREKKKGKRGKRSRHSTGTLI